MPEPHVEPNNATEREEFGVHWRAEDGTEFYSGPWPRVRAQHLLREGLARTTRAGQLMSRTVTTSTWWPTEVLAAGPASEAWAIGGNDGRGLHAIRPSVADSTMGELRTVEAECGAAVKVFPKWGVFERGNEHLDTHGACAYCAWTVAIATGNTHRELVALHPASAAQHDTLVRELPNPLLYLEICRKLLRDLEDEGPAERFVQLLAVASEHRPQVFLPAWCCEGDCGHDTKSGECFAASDLVVCGACTVTAGSWAGEYEGQVEVLVRASECAVLPAMARTYSVEVPA
jgi:hypothetical protein